jgi:hypothetical protein
MSTSLENRSLAGLVFWDAPIYGGFIGAFLSLAARGTGYNDEVNRFAENIGIHSNTHAPLRDSGDLLLIGGSQLVFLAVGLYLLYRDRKRT